MPGVKDFSIEDDRHWTAKVVIPLGLGGLKMSINFEKVEEPAPDYARLNAKGTGVGAMLNMDTQFELSESGDGTETKWEVDAAHGAGGVDGAAGAAADREPAATERSRGVRSSSGRSGSGGASSAEPVAAKD